MGSEIVATTDVGRQRDHNEDSVVAVEVSDEVALLAVADGMGGHSAGDVASHLAIETVRAEIGDEYETLPARSEWQRVLDDAIGQANRRIHERASDDRSGMGTTLVVALVGDDKTVIGNVGDSRAYRVGDTGLEQVTVDQSLVQELVEQGQITEDEAADHPQRNVVSQSLGTDESVDPDFYETAVGETLLFCSDGLNEEVADETIERIISNASSLSEAAENLIDRANENGGSDNVSVALTSQEREP
jgi:protein phosphatase